MTNEEFENIVAKIREFLLGFGGPAPFGKISRYVNAPPEDTENVLIRLVQDRIIVKNEGDMTFLRTDNETTTYYLPDEPAD